MYVTINKIYHSNSIYVTKDSHLQEGKTEGKDLTEQQDNIMLLRRRYALTAATIRCYK